MSRDSETVSKNMRSIHSKDTSIELQLRKALWHKGYRYRKNYKALPGSPDIVLTKYKIAIFCDSEFFHGKDWEILKLRLEKDVYKRQSLSLEQYISFCKIFEFMILFFNSSSTSIPPIVNIGAPSLYFKNSNCIYLSLIHI